jgi:hypothetical protein
MTGLCVDGLSEELELYPIGDSPDGSCVKFYFFDLLFGFADAFAG